jgi:hypothetical protein
LRRIFILSITMIGCYGFAAWATVPIPDEVAKWAGENRAITLSTKGCGFSRHVPYCETQEGVDKLVAKYNAAKK